jgi:hypothetical protein
LVGETFGRDRERAREKERENKDGGGRLGGVRLGKTAKL